MTRFLIGGAIALWLPILAFGQEQAPSAQPPVPPAKVSAPAIGATSSTTSPSAGSGDKVVLKDGQVIVMRSMRRLSSETARAGEAVQFEVVKPVGVDDLVVIPEHAVATGRIVVADKKKRRLRAGKLTVVIEHVGIVTGQTAPLRPTEVLGAERTDYVQHLDPGPVVIFAAPVIILAAHGKEMEIPLAARATTYLDRDLVLDREAVQKAQAALPRPRADVGTVYIYRPMNGRDYPNNITTISCGEVLLGLFHPGQFVRLQLPPGQYWLRANVPFRVGVTVDTKYVDGKRNHFFPLDVQQEHSYYLRLATRSHHGKSWEDLEQVDEVTGKDAVFAARSWADLGLEEITLAIISRLQTQPKAVSDKDERRSRY